MALGKANPEHLIPEKSALLIAMTSLAATVSAFLFARGALKLIPILCGLASGYLVSVAAGIIDFSIVADAPWFAFPRFVLPEFKFDAIVFLVPAAIVPIIVHFGDILAVGEVTDKNYLIDPGAHRTLLGNGIATTFAACIGGPPVRIYAEITGTLAALKRAFFGKLGALFQTIPSPVSGGILIIFFGALVAVGINCLKKTATALTDLRNLLIVALILVFGIGGITFSAGAFTLKGVGLATIVGVFLNLILPDKMTTKES
jgi:uracil permease